MAALGCGFNRSLPVMPTNLAGQIRCKWLVRSNAITHPDNNHDRLNFRKPFVGDNGSNEWHGEEDDTWDIQAVDYIQLEDCAQDEKKT